MARATAEIELVALVAEATKTVKTFAKETQKQLDGIDFNSTVTAINSGFQLVKGAAQSAFSAIEGFASKAISESLEAEKANTELANALRVTGDFSQDAVENFDKLARSIQSTTKFTADSVKSSVALAKQYSLTNAEAERVVRISADLAAIQGTSLDEATRKVAQTLNGFVDKSLTKAIPGLKNLSKESLIAGDALSKIESRVKGSAEALGDTFSGAVFRAREASNDLLESFGNLVTNNPAITAGVNEIQRAFETLNSEFAKNESGLKSIVTEGFLFLVESAPAVITAIQFIDKVVSTTVVSFFTLGRSIGAIGAAIEALSRLDFQGIKEINEAVSADNASAFQANADRISAFYEPLLKTTSQLASNIRRVSDAAKDSAKQVGNLGKSTTGKGARLEENKAAAEEARKQIEAAAKDPIKQLFEIQAKQKGLLDGKTAVAVGAGIVNQILKGAEGAKQAVASVIGGIADTLIPGIGPVVGEIVGVLAQGPEKVRQTIREFVKAIPEVIQAIIESIPVLVEELSKALPEIINRLAERAPEIIQALVRQIPNVTAALAAQMPSVSIAIISGLIKAAPQIVEGFAKEFLKIPERFMKELLKNIPVLGGGGGGGGGGLLGGLGGIIGGIGDFFGDILPFAEGGRVPNNPKFEGDRFPARLNAGEQVLSKDLSSQLESFLEGSSGSGQPVVVNLVVGQQQLARAILDLNRGGFRLA